MVMFDVMIEIGVPGVPHKWIRDIGEHGIDQPQNRPLCQDTIHVDVLMHHQCVRSHVVELHRQVENTVNVGKVAEQEDGAWHQGGEVKDEMSQHQDISLVADNFPRPRDVWQDDMVVDDRWQLGRQVSQVD